MAFLAAQCSFQGGRTYNEDTVFFAQDGPVAVAIVADGLGGMGGGGVASHVAVEVLSRLFLAQPTVEREAIATLFERANRAVVAQQRDGLRMQSTVVALLCNGERCAVAHVGDSRLYHFSRNRLVFCTQDHSVSQMAVMAGEITARQIRFHADRNKVLRALGSEEPPQPAVSILRRPPGAGGAFLLCTDGFWEYVWEEEMAADLCKSATPERWLSYMTARIGRRVNGQNDNLSAVAIFYDDHP